MFLKSLRNIERKLLEVKEAVSYMSEAGEFCLRHISLISTHAENAVTNIKGAKCKHGGEGEFGGFIREIVNNGSNAFSEEEIIEKLKSYDSDFSIPMKEIVLAKDKMILQISEAYARNSEKILDSEMERARAESWMEDEYALSGGDEDCAFLEYALRLSSDRDDRLKRELIEKRLMQLGITEDDCMRIYAADQSANLMRMQNLLAMFYTVSKMNWENAFPMISYTERKLSTDPSGVYGAQDEESKIFVRKALEKIAYEARISERAAASEAIEMVKEKCFGNIPEVFLTDEGRKLLLLRLNAENYDVEKMIPDPHGRKLILAHIAITVLVLAVLFRFSGMRAFIIAFPAAWVSARHVTNRIISKLTPAKMLPRLKMESVPKNVRTIVMVPALIPDKHRAIEIMQQIETYGITDKNDNVDFLLLADFKDSKEQHEPGDHEIWEAVLSAREEMNLRAGRRKYFYLHRNRVWNEKDHIWMGRERKRGAIEDFNLLALGYENRFDYEGEDAEAIRNRYKYALTLDADTQMLPGTIEKLIGCIHHPMNRKYNIIQPRMEIMAENRVGRFSAYMSRNSGSDIYNACAQEPYQDFTGNGLFSGKGIYRIREFYEKTSDQFEDNTVLSHDMIEGILSGCGYAGDIALYEGFPKNIASYLKRTERWIRGDWQLLYYAFGKIKLKMLDRYKIFDNCLRSLFEISVLLLIIFSAWTLDVVCMSAAYLAVLLPYISPNPDFRNLFARISVLPDAGKTSLEGISRALYRMLVSHRKMLSWITANDADKEKTDERMAGVFVSLLMIPSIFDPVIFALSALPAFLFICGRIHIGMPQTEKKNMSLTEYAFLLERAKEIWKYFERYVKLGKASLPPDNVQLDPLRGAANRTSPTNIGMYISSVIAARSLDLIDENEMKARLKETADSVSKLDKWKGLLYNWYDIETLEPLKPRYVSSVDCGNLIAAFVLARNTLRQIDCETAEVYENFIKDAYVEALYDEDKKLFRIGYDAEKERLSESHYDLLASEARILSFVSMAEKGIEIKHWYALSRPCERILNTCVLKSWSGTMFEYMMPFILLPSAEGTLLAQSAEGVIKIQKKKSKDGIWGISESGFAAYDSMLNYQYRAFGIRELALSGDETGSVIAPYASIMALPFERADVIQNLMNMRQKELAGEFGYYEARDYTNAQTGETVYSFMTHHQGMSLCSIANALTDNELQRLFMLDVREKAYALTLSEKPFTVPVYKKKRKEELYNESADRTAQRIQERRFLRRFSNEYEEAHMLFSNDAEVYMNEKGEGFYRRNGIYANSWHQDPERYNEKLIPEIYSDGEKTEITGGELLPGNAVYTAENKSVYSEITCTISPENNAFLIRIKISNRTATEIDVGVKHILKLAMCDEEGIFAHPVFKDLFIRKLDGEENACVFKKIARNEGEIECTFRHEFYGFDAYEKSQSHLKLGQYTGMTAHRKLKAFENANVYIRMHLVREAEEINVISVTDEYFKRAQGLADSFSRTMLMCLGLRPIDYRHADRCVRRILQINKRRDKPDFIEGALWPKGIPGDKPILIIFIRDLSAIYQLKKLIRVHEYYRICRLHLPIVVIHASENGYFKPLRERIENTILSNGLTHLKGQMDGIHVFDESDVTEEELEQLKGISAFTVYKDFVKDTSEKKAIAKCVKKRLLPMYAERTKKELISSNGYGGFICESGEYEINTKKKNKPSAAWANLLVNGCFGAIATDRGIGCIWQGNSRNGRITPYDNDPEDHAQSVYAEVELNGRICPLMPGFSPEWAYEIRHGLGRTIYRVQGESLNTKSTWQTDMNQSVLVLETETENRMDDEAIVNLKARADFMMGTDARDKRFVTINTKEHMILAKGRMNGFAFAGFKEGTLDENGWMRKTIRIPPQAKVKSYFLIGWAETREKAEELFNKFNPCESLMKSFIERKEFFSQICFDTNNIPRDLMMNGFARYQTLFSRVQARCGLYQPGGAIGFRDQLQDMLSIMYFDSKMARKHIIECAAHQFPEGDALHWWHEPARGVRTRISDDVLFMTYVAKRYMDITGDKDILSERIPYLKSVPIPDGKEDHYFSAEPSEETDTLYGHIMAAFRKVYRTGNHGLLLMGSGDWNDGMNRIGIEGRGESVWLTEFMIFCISEFMEYAEEGDREFLSCIHDELKAAVEVSAWDGEWYLRAFNDKGEKVGSKENKECMIDLISQAWAVIAGMNEERCIKALESAGKYLVDHECRIIKLLAPPFEGKETDPGYISKYPAGVRENGGQYTHAACWYVKALAKAGFANEAWKAFDMLLPINRSDTREKADRYLSEPYVIAADISYGGQWCGVGGWTWYTGAAAWTFCVLLEDLFGFSIKKNKVSFRPLLSENMDELRLTIKYGKAIYHLRANREHKNMSDEYALVDNGREQEILFGCRESRKRIENTPGI